MVSRRCNDLRIDFNHCRFNLRQPVIYEFGHGPAAQPDHKNIFGLWMKQGKTHHALGIGQLQVVRLGQSHSALHHAATEVESANPMLLAHMHAAVAARIGAPLIVWVATYAAGMMSEKSMHGTHTLS